MTYTIYLYGSGATSTGQKDSCYLKCEIPTEVHSSKSGLMPSVLHSYIMYAKDIGLLVTDVICEGFEDKLDFLDTQMPYSLWPLFYVNNSAVFTEGDAPGVDLCYKQDEELTYKSSIRLNRELAYYYRVKATKIKMPNLGKAKKATNPLPKPNSVVTVTESWFLDLTVPKKEDSKSDASTYAIVKHYNKLVIADTLSDMFNIISKPDKFFDGLKAATGKTLKDIIDRPHSYNALMPAWESTWGDKPGWYDEMRLSMNNYNISASLFLYDKDTDPDLSKTKLELFGTASNIKGVIKSGHAETRLLLTLDAMNYAAKEMLWYTSVLEFYEFSGIGDIKEIINLLQNKNIALISSLKPCYLCVGEVDATTDGFIKTIDSACVDMWAAFSNSSINTSLKKVVYFDIDEPIEYPGTINVTVHIDKNEEYNWSLSLCPWFQWTASAQLLTTINRGYNSPIGPRIVEPAGECLKTGFSYIRYRNSSEILLKEGELYYQDFQILTSTVANENEVEQ
jgi:hypothetical protein